MHLKRLYLAINDMTMILNLLVIIYYKFQLKQSNDKLEINNSYFCKKNYIEIIMIRFLPKQCWYNICNWRPPSLSELIPMIFNTELTHLGSETSNYH